MVRVALTGTSPGPNVFQNVWHYIMTGGAGADENDFLAAVAAQWATAIANVIGWMSNQYSFHTFEAWLRDTGNHRWDGIASLPITPVTGGSGSDGMPHGAAAITRIITGRLRRQGRNFLPGFNEAASNNGVFLSGVLTDMADYALDFSDVVTPTGGTFTWCTYNDDPVSPVYESESQEAGGVIANGVVGYQRRRKPGVGL